MRWPTLFTIPILILALALSVRLAGAAVWQAARPADQPFFFGDSLSYWELARDIARGQPYEYQQAHIFRTPGYPLFLAPLFLIGGEHPPVWIARVLGALCGTATVGLVMALASHLFDERRVAILAGLFAAFSPEAIAGSVFVLSEALFCPLMVAQLLLTYSAWDAHCPKRRAFRAFVGGIVGGLATLTRPSWLLFLPLVLVGGMLLRMDRRRWAMLCGMQLLGLCAAMSPWWIRNYGVSGEFVPTTTEVGASLYDGWHDRATGGSEMSFKNENFPATADPQWQQRTDIERELAADRHYRSAATAWAAAHPRRVAELAGIKFLRLWNVWPNANEFRSGSLRWIITVGYLPLIAGAAFGWWRLRADPRVALLLAPAIYFTLLHMVFVSSIRYRLPPLLPLMVLAAAGWWQTSAWRKSEEALCSLE